MEDKKNQKEELEKEIDELQKQVEIEELKKQRDELREKLRIENNEKEIKNANITNVNITNNEDDDEDIEYADDKKEKIKGMLIVVLSALAALVIIIAVITVMRMNRENKKQSEKIENKQTQKEKTDSEDKHKSNVEVVVSTPQTSGSTQNPAPNTTDSNVVIPETPVSDTSAQENQSTKQEEEIQKGTEYYTKSTKGPVNVRKTSSINSELQDELPDGIVLKFIGKEGKWYRVSYTINNQTREGFIHLSQIRKK